MVTSDERDHPEQENPVAKRQRTEDKTTGEAKQGVTESVSNDGEEIPKQNEGAAVEAAVLNPEEHVDGILSSSEHETPEVIDISDDNDGDEEEYRHMVQQAKDVQAKLDEIDKDMKNEINKIECEYHNTKSPIYKERDALIEQIPGFWLKTLASHPVLHDYITQVDRQILKYLKNISVSKTTSNEDLQVECRLLFSENEHLKNTVLSKTFHRQQEKQTLTSFTEPEFSESYDETPTFFQWFSTHFSDSDPDGNAIADAIVKELWPSPFQYYHLQKTELETPEVIDVDEYHAGFVSEDDDEGDDIDDEDVDEDDEDGDEDDAGDEDDEGDDGEEENEDEDEEDEEEIPFEGEDPDVEDLDEAEEEQHDKSADNKDDRVEDETSRDEAPPGKTVEIAEGTEAKGADDAVGIAANHKQVEPESSEKPGEQTTGASGITINVQSISDTGQAPADNMEDEDLLNYQSGAEDIDMASHSVMEQDDADGDPLEVDEPDDNEMET
eukprot:Clim_evm81s172 gene=Clim_evmTU81s172